MKRNDYLPEELRLARLGSVSWAVARAIDWRAAGLVGRVPVGFRTDLASVPLTVSVLAPVVGPAVVHDHLYATGLVSRRRADAVLYALMRYRGYSRTRSGYYWLACRAFGWRAWRRHRRAQAKKEA